MILSFRFQWLKNSILQEFRGGGADGGGGLAGAGHHSPSNSFARMFPEKFPAGGNGAS
jgi:hypothetical protein